jgi:hypothetical protein
MKIEIFLLYLKELKIIVANVYDSFAPLQTSL